MQNNPNRYNTSNCLKNKFKDKGGHIYVPNMRIVSLRFAFLALCQYIRQFKGLQKVIKQH